MHMKRFFYGLLLSFSLAIGSDLKNKSLNGIEVNNKADARIAKIIERMPEELASLEELYKKNLCKGYEHLHKIQGPVSKNDFIKIESALNDALHYKNAIEVEYSNESQLVFTHNDDCIRSQLQDMHKQYNNKEKAWLFCWRDVDKYNCCYLACYCCYCSVDKILNEEYTLKAKVELKKVVRSRLAELDKNNKKPNSVVATAPFEHDVVIVAEAKIVEKAGARAKGESKAPGVISMKR